MGQKVYNPETKVFDRYPFLKKSNGPGLALDSGEFIPAETLNKASKTVPEAPKHPWEGVDSQEAYKRGYEAGKAESDNYWNP